MSAWIAHAVCSPCNGWLNKHIEGPAQRVGLPKMVDPFLDPNVVFRIRPIDQRPLAAWAAKVVLLFPYIDTRNPRRSDPRQLRALRRFPRPPRGSRVWIGAFAGRAGEDYVRLWDSGDRINSPTGPIRHFVFYMGHVAFRVALGPYRSPYPPPAGDPRKGPWFRIWPPAHRTLIFPTPPMDNGYLAADASSIPTP